MPDKRRLVTSNICFGSEISGLLQSFLSLECSNMLPEATGERSILVLYKILFCFVLNDKRFPCGAI